VLGKVFTAFMTGNLVYLGLSVTGAGGPDLVAVSVSLIAFSVGVMVARRIAGGGKAESPWPAVVSQVLGVTVAAQAAFWAVWVTVSGRPSGHEVELLIALSALAMGAQSGAVLKLGVTAVFTTAATATVIVLMSDYAGGEGSTAEGPRLQHLVVALVVGAGAGGLLLTHARLYAPALPMLVTAAVIVAASVAVTPRNAG
jgi:uncharacterized membrane protein YoaK (UPF0700 family)